MTENKDLFEDIIEVQSESDPNVKYQINKLTKVCNCPSFKKSGKAKSCKHLIKVGLKEKKKVNYPVYPAYSQSMSGFVKAGRLRYTAKALYWLVHLWSFPDSRYRMLRRIWILAAEDNQSLPVMEKTSRWYKDVSRDINGASFFDAAVEVVRICKTDNWWKDEGGQGYILAWKRADEYYYAENLKQYSCDVLLEKMFAFIEQKDQDKAIACMSAAHGAEGFDPYAMGKKLLALAERDGNLEARRTCQLFMRHRGSQDINFSGQTVYRLIKGSMGNQVNMKVDPAEVEAYIAEAKAMWDNPKPIESWMCDGLHCAGEDRRFAGMSNHMYACVQAYKHYGRLHEDDAHLPDFFIKEG